MDTINGASPSFLSENLTPTGESQELLYQPFPASSLKEPTSSTPTTHAAAKIAYEFFGDPSSKGKCETQNLQKSASAFSPLSIEPLVYAPFTDPFSESDSFEPLYCPFEGMSSSSAPSSGSTTLPTASSCKPTDSPVRFRCASSIRKILSKALTKVLILTAGAAQIRAQGMEPKIIAPRHMLEAVEETHHLFSPGAKSDSNLSEVTYLSAEERKAYEVKIHDGLLIRNDSPYSTKEEFSKWSESGTAIFVQGPDKKFYMGSHNLGKFHHSSFLSGGAVISAGEIETNSDGKILKISNKSGHYFPEHKQNIAMLRTLKEQGVDLSTIIFEEILPNGTTCTYPSALDYLERSDPLKPTA